VGDLLLYYCVKSAACRKRQAGFSRDGQDNTHKRYQICRNKSQGGGAGQERKRHQRKTCGEFEREERGAWEGRESER
jgi:hypothetical protein